MITTADSRVFALIRALEIDSRLLVERFLEPTIGLEEIVNPFQSKIAKRTINSKVQGQPLEYLDFGDIFEIFNSNRKHFPSDVILDLETLRGNTTKIVQIRNAVMHGRSLKEDDEESLVLITKGLQSSSWPNLKKTIDQLEDATFVADFEVHPDESTVLHNLPRPEHNDTSLIGRRSEVKAITDLMLQNRSSVVTITGPGGIGKTALALEVAYGFVERESPFDLILWATFKNEKLTVDGIVEIANTTKNFPELTHLFSNFLGNSLESTYQTLSTALLDIRTLICLDNLETVTGSDFIDFYNAMPESCKFLVTSRKGIGQIERRFDLSPISKKDAVHYIHQLIRNHRVSELQKASPVSIEGIVERYGNNPLAIKWFVQSVSAGIPITEIFRYREKEFFEFCVGTVVEQLSLNAHRILLTLKHLNRFVSIEELLLLTGIEEVNLNTAIRELLISSLLESRISGSEIRQQVQLTESASRYISSASIKDEDFLVQLKREESRIKQDETDRQKDLLSPYSPYAIATRSKDDIPIAAMLRKALRESRSNQLKALELVESARRLAPDYWEVDKTEAILRYWGNEHSSVPPLYESAITKAPSSESKAISYYLFAGFCARQGQGARALELIANIPDSLLEENVLSLRGDCRLRIGMIEQGLDDLRKSTDSKDAKTVIVNKTRLMKGYERIAEYVMDREKNFSKAFGYLNQGLQVFEDLYEQKVRDFKLWENYCGLLFVGLKILEKSNKMNETLYEESLDRFEELLKFVSYVLTDRRYGPSIRASFRRQSSLSDRFLQMLQARNIDVQTEPVMDKQVNPVVYVGTIISWREEKKFGFISSENFPYNVFFNETSLFPGQDVADVSVDRKVSFEIVLNYEPKPGSAPKAQFVQILVD